MGRRRTLGALPDAVEAIMGIAPPNGAGWTGHGNTSLIGISPDTWLALREEADHRWSDELAAKLAGLASVSDQSSAYRIFELVGPRALRILSQGASIDLHPSVFQPGCAHVTTIGKLDALIWQIDAAPTFRVGISRSYATNFLDWLRDAASAPDPVDRDLLYPA